MVSVAGRRWRGRPGFSQAVVITAFLSPMAIAAVTLHTMSPRARAPVIAPPMPSVAIAPVTREELPPLDVAGLWVHPASADHLERVLDGLAFDLDAIGESMGRVPRVRVASLPEDLGGVTDITRRKALFLRIALPLVLLANEEVRQQRLRILDIHRKGVRGAAPSDSERRWLAVMAGRYEVTDGDPEALLRRVDTVPVSLALAQSIEESGWGTSRFAREGNALYGQRTWSRKIAGLVPVEREHRQSFRVRSFASLLDSARAYLFNLNTHPAYEHLRVERARLRAAGQPLDGAHLAASLLRYAERGEAYVRQVRGLMRTNRLASLDHARLAPVRGVRIATRVTGR